MHLLPSTTFSSVKHDIANAFGNTLLYFRLQKDFSQEDLSAATNLGRSFLSDLENGKKIPTLLTIYKISIALNISLLQIIKEVEKHLHKDS